MSHEQSELTQLATEDIESPDDEHVASRKTSSLLSKRWTIVAGVFVALAFVGVVSRGRWTSPVSSTAKVDASISLAESGEKVWSQITCPVIGALFKAGDLLPNEDGFVSRKDCVDAMIRVGISSSLAKRTSKANFAHLPSPQKIDIFSMNLDMQDEDGNEMKNKEHDKSTGIRDGDAPDEERFKEFEQFIGSDGSDDTWSQDDIKAAIKHYQRSGNDKDVDSDPGGLNSIKAMFNQFANEDSKLSKDEWRALYMESEYPEFFNKNRLVAIEKWDADIASSK